MGDFQISAEMELVEALTRGDESAWVELDEKFGSVIRSAVRDTMGDSYQGFDVDDAYQEILEVLIDDNYAALSQFEGRAAFSTWLWSLARHTTRPLLRDTDSPAAVR